MNTIAVLTIKRFGAAKQRLGDVEIRPALAEAMMADVLAALAHTNSVTQILVVSGEPRAAAVAGDFGAEVFEDPDTGHNPAAARGVAAAIERGADGVLLAAGDCPLLDSAELDGLLGGESDRVVVLADRHGTGTNGLILFPPRAIESSFGAGSCERHAVLAEQAGVACRVEKNTSMALDVDTPEDLRALAAAIGDSAPRTRAVLAQAGLL
jgi:2-phospho-L-lactate guanylyltransferase